MPIPMMKYNGKMLPARKDPNGRWVPMEDSELSYDGERLSVVEKTEHGKEKEEEN